MRTCIYCNTEIEGRPNKKYCSRLHKQYDRTKRRAKVVKVLKKYLNISLTK